MQKRPEILIQQGTEFVGTGEIPALIADALYPDVKYLQLPIIDIYKRSTKVTSRSSRWYENFKLTRSSTKWYEELNDDDELGLQVIWANLPKLEFPIAMEKWQPYANAFVQLGATLGWELMASRVEWIVDPGGDEKYFYDSNQLCFGIADTWLAEDEPEDIENISSASIRQCGFAELSHTEFLRSAIEKSEIVQLDPNSNIPTTIYNQHGKVSIEAFVSYAAKFRIVVHHSSSETKIHLNEADDLAVSAETFVVNNQNDVVPGRLPNTAIGKLAIKAAWQIECATKMMATANQVIDELKRWVDTESTLIEEIPNGVKWETTKGKEKTFDVATCAKALNVWNASRT